MTFEPTPYDKDFILDMSPDTLNPISDFDFDFIESLDAFPSEPVFEKINENLTPTDWNPTQHDSRMIGSTVLSVMFPLRNTITNVFRPNQFGEVEYNTPDRFVVDDKRTITGSKKGDYFLCEESNIKAIQRNIEFYKIGRGLTRKTMEDFIFETGVCVESPFTRKIPARVVKGGMTIAMKKPVAVDPLFIEEYERYALAFSYFLKKTENMSTAMRAMIVGKLILSIKD